MGSVSAVLTAAALLGATAAIYRFLSPNALGRRPAPSQRMQAPPGARGVELIEDPKTGVYKPK